LDIVIVKEHLLLFGENIFGVQDDVFEVFDRRLFFDLVDAKPQLFKMKFLFDIIRSALLKRTANVINVHIRTDENGRKRMLDLIERFEQAEPTHFRNVDV